MERTMVHFGVWILTDEVPLPVGGASTNRLKNMAKMYRSLGGEPFIVSLFAKRFRSNCEDKLSGVVDGIRYASLWERRSNRSIRNKIVDFASAVWKLLQRIREEKPAVVHLYSASPWLTISAKLISLLFGHKIVVEVVEWNRVGKSRRNSPGAKLTLLAENVAIRLGDGLIVISDFIFGQIKVITKRYQQKGKWIKVPILVDTNCKDTETGISGEKYFFWAADLGYTQTLNFLLDAFRHLVFDLEITACKLKFCGFNASPSAIAELQTQIARRNLGGFVEFLGFVEYTDLLSYYRHAIALLAPLHDDDRSRARFPSKIGEYLMSGRPVITTGIGEIPNYFNNNVNAFLVNCDDVTQFAKALRTAFVNRSLSESVGSAGRDLALKAFSWQSNVRRLQSLMTSLGVDTSQ